MKTFVVRVDTTETYDVELVAETGYEALEVAFTMKDREIVEGNLIMKTKKVRKARERK